ncbi:MAG: hypothetical protein ABIR39_13680 [Nocardioides sp.]|uniref:hypothetical protein n=1 Tax=Nocardioides sp. TaxID=35761 RepID=UPI0032630E68
MTGPDNGVDLLLRRATDNLRPDVDRLVAGGITRGRTRQRRARIGTAVAAVAVFGVIGAAAAVVPLGGSPDSARHTDIASDPTTTSTTPPAPVEDTKAQKKEDRELREVPAPLTATLAVGVADFAQTIASLAPGHEVTQPLTETSYPLVDEVEEQIAHFGVDGMLATVTIMRSSSAFEWECRQGAELGNRVCTQLADGAWQQVWGPDTADQVTAQGVTVWRHGFAVSVLSYNAAEGKDLAPLQPEPALSLAELTAIATSDVWFN